MGKKIQLLLVAFLFFVAGALIFINYQIDNQRFTLYINPKEKYSVLVPVNWQIQEQTNINNFEDQVAVQSSPKLSNTFGSIVSIVFIVMPPNSNQPLTSKKEFTTWYNKQPEKITYDKLQKVKNATVTGEKAVILSDTNITQTTKGWNYIVWFIKNNKTYYMQFLGDSKFENASWSTINTILSSFIFK